MESSFKAFGPLDTVVTTTQNSDHDDDENNLDTTYLTDYDQEVDD
jgi:hypothetical protein